MSIGFQHPNVKVHIGDGFEFLKNRQNEFDVIITDSSDPEGPAESLFQKPYFELLRDALRDGGVITTQGCSLFFFLLPPPHYFHYCLLCPSSHHPLLSSPSYNIQPQKTKTQTKGKIRQADPFQKTQPDIPLPREMLGSRCTFFTPF